VTHSYGHISIAVKESADVVTIQFSNPIDVSTYNTFDPNVFFDRFYTADTTRVSNTGLGLSIVKLLSEKLGGKALATIENGMITFHIKLRKKLQQN
jgi:signal transduction histidine kinase